MLKLNDITTSYGGARAISDVSLHVASGQALTILGRNGAGKTTTLKTIMGLLKPIKGTVSFNDEDITAKAPDQIAQLGIGYVPEDRRVFAGLTVIENLEAARKLNPGAGTLWTASALLDLFPEIARRQDSLAGTLSGGEQQMLSIARAMMGNPSLLLLDEPSEGLAPVVVNRLGESLLELQSQGVSMLVSEQNQRLARRITKNVLLIDTGMLVFTGSFAKLDQNPDVIQRHLGV
jgi:branched-chain amino acid transport system ATP-binding protein